MKVEAYKCDGSCGKHIEPGRGIRLQGGMYVFGEGDRFGGVLGREIPTSVNDLPPDMRDYSASMLLEAFLQGYPREYCVNCFAQSLPKTLQNALYSAISSTRNPVPMHQ